MKPARFDRIRGRQAADDGGHGLPPRGRGDRGRGETRRQLRDRARDRLAAPCAGAAPSSTSEEQLGSGSTRGGIYLSGRRVYARGLQKIAAGCLALLLLASNLAAAAEGSAGGIRWTVPARWQPAAARPMRMATYTVPGAPGGEARRVLTSSSTSQRPTWSTTTRPRTSPS